MKRLLLSITVAALPFVANAQTSSQIIDDIVNKHIITRFELLRLATRRMDNAAHENCDPTSEKLRERFGIAMDSWISVSHLRFGPTEIDDRAFAISFWPDTRGATPRALAALIGAKDPIAQSADDYAEVSIAARGLYAMEFLLYDADLRATADPAYFCTLLKTVSADTVANTTAILDDWKSDYAQRLMSPSAEGTYRTEEEVLQELFKSLTTGLQFTSETRLGRPLGTFDRPRPTRAENRRSNRSAINVAVSLAALENLALRLSANDQQLTDKLKAAFNTAQDKLDALNDPIFAGVSNPQTRLKVEVVQQSVDNVRTIVRDELGPILGVAAGFNSLDGD